MDAAGRRALSVHSRLQDARQDGAWTRHASGSLAQASPSLAFDLREWPPSGATQVDTQGFYAALESAGLVYGPEFQGLRAVYKRGDELFAEAKLPDAAEKDAARFALHPALLDSALQALAFEDDQAKAFRMPFSWSGVSLRSVGATTLRVRVHCPKGESSRSLLLADASGEPLASVQALAMRATSAEQLRSPGAPHLDALFRIDWSELQGPTSPPIAPSGVLLGTGGLDLATRVPLDHYTELAALRAALDQGASPPSLVIAPFIALPTGDLIASAHETTARALDLLQAWLADERLASSRLALVTRRAVATHAEEDVEGLAHAPLWGLARSAQSEHPERPLVLVDLDDSEASQHALLGALDMREPEIALRNGKPFVPRLSRLPQAPADTASPAGLEGTVLITGGTGALGALVARLLVVNHNAKHLLLTSRQGASAPGADVLRSELEALGASVTLAACDVTDPSALKDLLDSVPSAHPLAAVVHAASALDGGLLGAMSLERIDRVLAPKLDAAWHLHQLTQGKPLAAFVLFSSVPGVLGSPGHSNYAAASAFLDALAHHRRAQGLPASSLAWGHWAERSATTEHVSAGASRMDRAGLPSTSEERLALVDAALFRPEPALVLARFDLSALSANTGSVPPLFQRLVRVHTVRKAARNTAQASSLPERLSALPPAERERTLLDLVRTEAAIVLGLASFESLDPDRLLQELGLDSIIALQLRNRLAAATGVRLPATLLFDHPTPAALASLLMTRLEPGIRKGPAKDGESPTDTESEGALLRLIQPANEVGAIEEARNLIAAALKVRLAVEATSKRSAAAIAEEPPTRLARGQAIPQLICFPAFVVPSAPIQYARFASHFKDRRDIWFIPHQGYRHNTPLTRNLDELVSSHARTTLACARNSPFVLFGHSSGGNVAHMVAEHLERIGHGPAGVVLLDSYDYASPAVEAALKIFHVEQLQTWGASDAGLTAEAWYYEHIGLETWKPRQLTAPTLHVRATEPMKQFVGSEGAPAEWRASWKLPHVAIDAPGNHATVVDHPFLAQAVDDWLTSLSNEPSNQ
ncbi:type I polyketide synthase [Sorangium sp. So ce315]|uniref:type I polyketide synthase n=1 Tax=Sorangium sp. So ce315 TaxID=3133299 RepID=UPI003F619493